MKRATPKKRSIQTFEPCGPILQMLSLELIARTRGQENKRGAKVKLHEDLIVAALGKKYPKLMAEFQIIRAESER